VTRFGNCMFYVGCVYENLKNEGVEFYCDFQHTQCICCYGFLLRTLIKVDGLCLAAF
jgi:hypothetical protein